MRSRQSWKRLLHQVPFPSSCCITVLKIALNLENCYGIRKLACEFNYSTANTVAIYAPNGTMKSSLASTFSDIAAGQPSTDRMFPLRVTRRDVTDESGTPLPANSVFVMQPYDKEFQSDKTATLLVNATLRREYENLHDKVDAARTAFIEALKNQSRSKGNIEQELVRVFGEPDAPLLPTLRKLRAKLSIEPPKTPYKDVDYDKFFDEKIIGVLDQGNVKSAIADYIVKYNELLSNSKYFKKNVFNYYDGGEVAKNLGSHGFFSAGHRAILHSELELNVTTQKDLESLIESEKAAISDDPGLRKKFAEVDKALKKNVNLRSWEDYLLDHQELLPLLSDVNAAKAQVWTSYIQVHFDLLRDLVEKYEKAEKRRKEIEHQANQERTRWEQVIDIFNGRFFVPFKLSVGNKGSASLGVQAPALQFTFDDGSEKVAVDRDSLVLALSQGEKKALYILNIIFEVEGRRHAGQETLFVVDDIADSFDYKNKYAIIQYLQDIQGEALFRLLVLTHNFDFYRTLEGRMRIPRPNCLMAVKKTDEIVLEKGVGIRNIFVNDWKLRFFQDGKKRIACIPFQRNLIEYQSGVSDPDYIWLTSLLHWKSDTDQITQGDLDGLFTRQFKVPGNWPDSNNIVVDDLFAAAELCVHEPEGINFENKIVLSIAIRMGAEKFMVQEINDPVFLANITSIQTQALAEEFKRRMPNRAPEIDVLQRVQLMTPESIHLNSFMYEPILDMSDTHLRKLYQDVKAL